MRIRPLFPVLACLSVFLAAAPQDDPRVEIVNLRRYTHPNFTRIVLEIGRLREYTSGELQDPGRIYVDVLQAKLNPILQGQSYPVKAEYISQVRISQKTPSTVRVVVDVEFPKIQSYRVYHLFDPFRLVLDIYPRETKVPPSPTPPDKALPPIDKTQPPVKREVAPRDPNLVGTSMARQLGLGVRTIVIDPGHGGDDTGARGIGGVQEKNVTLAVAQDLAAGLNKVPGLRALLTRDADYFVPLRQRYRIAEQAHADLFVSVHCNSSHRRGSGNGTEVFFLSLKGASDQADKDLADVENAADLVGGVPPQAEDDVVNVLYDVKRNSALERSQLLAETLLDHVAADRRVESRGIKQAGFAVLKSVEFPSVLVETAFINNPREVKLLRDPEFQRELGQQLTSGVLAYFSATGVRIGAAPDTARTPAGASGAVVH